jgi:hypothetical protein
VQEALAEDFGADEASGAGEDELHYLLLGGLGRNGKLWSVLGCGAGLKLMVILVRLRGEVGLLGVSIWGLLMD